MGTSLMIIAGIVVGLAVVVGVIWYLISRELSLRRLAPRAAKDCRAAIAALTEYAAESAGKICGIAEKVSAEDIAPIYREFGEACTLFETAKQRFRTLEQRARKPGKKGFTAGEYEDLGRKFRSVYVFLEDVRHRFGDVNTFLSRLMYEVDSAPARIVSIAETIAKAEKSLAHAKSEGIRTAGLDVEIADAGKKLDEARTALSEKRIIASATLCDEARRLAEGAVSGTDHLPLIRESILVEIWKQRGRYAQLEARVIGSNGAERFHVEKAGEKIEEASILASFERQDWDSAGRSLSMAHAHLTDAATLISRIEAEKNAPTGGAVKDK